MSAAGGGVRVIVCGPSNVIVSLLVRVCRKTNVCGIIFGIISGAENKPVDGGVRACARARLRRRRPLMLRPLPVGIEPVGGGDGVSARGGRRLSVSVAGRARARVD